MAQLGKRAKMVRWATQDRKVQLVNRDHVGMMENKELEENVVKRVLQE
jgi:hypothetical protein